MLSNARRPLLVALWVASAFLVALPAAAAKRASRKSPHGEIVAETRVETAPVPKTHKNHRQFLEFDVRILSFTRAPEGDKAKIRASRSIRRGGSTSSTTCRAAGPRSI